MYCLAMGIKHNWEEYNSSYPAFRSSLRPFLYQRNLEKSLNILKIISLVCSLILFICEIVTISLITHDDDIMTDMHAQFLTHTKILCS